MCVRVAGLLLQLICIVFVIEGMVKILLLLSLEVVVKTFVVRHSQTSTSLDFIFYFFYLFGQHFLCCLSVESYHRIYKWKTYCHILFFIMLQDFP